MDRRKFLLLAGASTLSACGAPKVWAPDEMVARMAFRDPGPSYVQLMTMIANHSGSGAHTALMINASQRVIWDPFGSFTHPSIPERNDVIYGVNDNIAQVFRSAHARSTHHVVMQTKEVPDEVAEQAFTLAKAAGPVTHAHCAIATSKILSQLPGFESIRRQWFPGRLMKDFAALPGVTTDRLFEDDDGNKQVALRNFKPEDL